MSSLFAGGLAPKEYDEILIEPASKPTKIYYKKAGETIRTLTLTYEGATENVEKIVVT